MALPYTAQWSDDIHHALHTAITGESHWHYADFHARPELLGRSLAQGLAFQGEYKPGEQEDTGEPSAFLPPTAFVSYVQNHDQAGNRPFGERITAIAPKRAVRSAAAISILSPHIPLLFMGEEWAAPEPFLYFSDANPELAEQIRKSRCQEFADSPDAKDENRALPDPVSEDSFMASKLDWSELRRPVHADWLSLYKKLLHLRHTEIVPRLEGVAGYAGHFEIIANRVVKVWWTLADGTILTVVANLSPEPLDGFDAWAEGRHLWLEGIATGTGLDPWTVVVSLREPEQRA